MANFGVAGFPKAFSRSASGKNRENIFPWLRSMGLNALELQMTYGPRMSITTCRRYAELAKDYQVKLSVHASYFIVLTSPDAEKVARSIDTLLKTFDLADELGATVVVLHPGSMYGQTSAVAVDRFVNNAHRFFDLAGRREVSLFVETAGKLGQLGSVDEILQISECVSSCFPCVDFGHVHARTLGTLDNEDAIAALVAKLRSRGVFRNDRRVHFHYTPIDYGPKGEIKHKSLRDQYPIMDQKVFDFGESLSSGYYHPRPEPIARELKNQIGSDVTIIAETHDSQEEGAKVMKKLFG